MTNNEYYVCDGWGDSIDSPSVEEMQDFLDKLDIDDPEHCDVWLFHTESGWTLGCLPNNEVYLVNDAERQNISPRHLTNVSRDKMLALWRQLSGGQMAEIEKEAWLPGYTSAPPPPPDPKDIHRSFWNVLINAERRSDVKCKAEGCSEKPIVNSVFCPGHHFETVVKIPCPY